MSPNSDSQWVVGTCTADLVRQLLLRGNVAVKIRPKEWALLIELLKHPNALVTSSFLINALWPRQDVDPKQLVNIASGLRRALGTPDALRSVHRRGYVLTASPITEPVPPTGDARRPAQTTGSAPAHFVGQESELQALRNVLGEAMAGLHYKVEIRGVAGVGKSTLLTQWLAEVFASGEWTVLMGQAYDLSCEFEPFGPLIQMLQEHCRTVDSGKAKLDLRRWAPCWLAQFPDLMNPSEVAQNQSEVYRSSEGRMHREGVELICNWAREKPLMLVLEDIQWADSATLDFLDLLTKRGRFLPLIIATTRRVLGSKMPEATRPQALQQHQGAPFDLTITLKGFRSEDVRAYLARRLPDLYFRDDQVQLLTRHTEGLPLHVRSIVDGLQSAGPHSPEGTTVDQLLGSVVDHLSHFVVDRVMSLSMDLRALVNVACCLPDSVPVPVFAQVLEDPEPVVDDRCQQLVQSGLFTAAPHLMPWKDQRVVKAYGLAHGLYREALYAEIPRSLSMTLSRRLAAALGPKSPSLPFLSAQFAQLGMHEESAAALRMTSLRSLGRFSTRNAVRALEASLSQLQQSASTGDTLDQQLETCLDLSRILMNIHSITDDRVESVRDSIIALAPKVNTERAKFVLAATLCTRHILGGRSDLAQAPVVHLKRCSTTLGIQEKAVFHRWSGSLSFAMGRLDDGVAAFATCMALPLTTHGLAGLDSRVLATTQMTWGLAMKGQLSTFLESAQKLEETVNASRSAYLQLDASFWLADAMRQLGCFGAAERRFRELLELCELSDSATYRNLAQMGLLACVDPAERDLAALQALSSAARGTRPDMGDHMLSIVTLQTMIAQGLLDQAADLVRRTEQMDEYWPFYRPERLRLKGQVAHARGQTKQARAFRQEALALNLERGFLPGVLRDLQDEPSLYSRLTKATDRSKLDELLRPLLTAELDNSDLQPLRAAREALQVSLNITA